MEDVEFRKARAVRATLLTFAYVAICTVVLFVFSFISSNGLKVFSIERSTINEEEQTQDFPREGELLIYESQSLVRSQNIDELKVHATEDRNIAIYSSSGIMSNATKAMTDVATAFHELTEGEGIVRFIAADGACFETSIGIIREGGAVFLARDSGWMGDPAIVVKIGDVYYKKMLKHIQAMKVFR